MQTIRSKRDADLVVSRSKWERYKKRPVTVSAVRMPEEFAVATKEGTMTGKPGDFLVEGVEGELYPCDSGIFFKTYKKEGA